MKTILFPTDFSKASDAALKFAIEIAKRSSARIIVTNAYLIPVLNLDVPPLMMEELYEEEKKFSESELIKTCEKISAHKYANGKHLQCEFVAKHSLPVGEISKLALDTKADLIIMGTNARENTLSVIGSTTVGVINKTLCPVLIVHEDTRYEDLKQIHFAVEDLNEEMKTVIRLTDLARLFNAEITILHVEPVEKIGDYISLKETSSNAEKLASEISQYARYEKIKFKSIVSDNVSEALDSYLHSHSVNLLVLLKKERGWLENLFHKSVIKNLLRKETLPLLVLYKNE